MKTEIKNLNDVEDFVKTLVAEGIIFHPDDDFNFTVNIESGSPAFSPEKSRHLNSLMEQCFQVCEVEGVDIYNFMLGINLRETGMDSFIPIPS